GLRRLPAEPPLRVHGTSPARTRPRRRLPAGTPRALEVAHAAQPERTRAAPRRASRPRCERRGARDAYGSLTVRWKEGRVTARRGAVTRYTAPMGGRA